MSNGWHILRDDGRYVLARRLPARFDIEATSAFPPLDPARLARQVRQDVWRALKSLRGFTPVVEITCGQMGVIVRAGGQMANGAAIPPTAHRDLAELLSDPSHRARWSRWAGKRRRGRA